MDTLRNYTFLPWLRQGLAAEISTDDRLGSSGAEPAPERAEVSVSFKVNGQPVSKPVQLLGPGDVVGINPRVVVKTDPRNWVTDFESNYLPYIEFYEEDFPWRFTPATAKNDLALSRLRPWIFLLILAEGEFEEKRTGGPLAALEIKADLELNALFPNPEQSWAWAHVHVSQNIIGAALQTTTGPEARGVEQMLQNTLALNPDTASSRLLCPRKLQNNTAYHAFVIPAFETGRLTGLGQDTRSVDETDGQQPSWGEGQRLYPIYYRWFFRTGAKGDFEFLVDLLEPRPVDKRVGVRDMDLQRPGYEVDGMSHPLDVMGLEGALRSPETESSPAVWPPDAQRTDFQNPPPGSAGHFLNQLEAKINLQFVVQQEETQANPHPDPIISPPLYGKWYALAERLDVQHPTGWVDELNRDPRQRVPAGVGTTVIQQNQERLMQQAWAQLGDLLQTNQKIRQLQLGWMTSYRIYRKHVLPQAPDTLLAFTQAVQARVLGSPTTIAQQVRESRLPGAALNPAFRKITRPRGALMRKVIPNISAPGRPVLSQLNTGALTAAPPPPDPVGQLSLDRTADVISPSGIPEWLRQWVENKTLRWVLGGLLLLSVLLAVLTGLFGLLGLMFALLFDAGLLPLSILLIATIGLFGLFGLLSLVSAGFLFITERWRRQLAVSRAFREASFKPKAVDEISARPNFALTEFGQMMVARSAGSADSVEAANFRVALKDAFNVYQSPPPLPPVRQPLDMRAAAVQLQQALNPAVAIPRRAEFMLKIPARVKDLYLRPHKTIVPVMAHPVFAEAMYRPLRDVSSELLVPNLDLIPNNTISLMVTNQRFIEAYMVGLNQEFGRELLWREFPTDQRGSYFRQFWEVADTVNRDPNKTAAQLEEELLDITRLHTWGRTTALGAHANRPLPDGAEPGEARLVLVIRGDLLKKYPTAVIYAQQARWSQDEGGRDIRTLDDGPSAQTIQTPLFKAEIEPDIHFLGFDLTATIAKGSADRVANQPGWFFVIQERPGEPRFGLDNQSDETPEAATRWDELAWEHLPNFNQLGCIDFAAGDPGTGISATPDNLFHWGQNAAEMAYILYQVPVMVAFHAADMLS